MEATRDSADDVEKILKLQLLAEETSDCVCSRVWEKGLILGWRPSVEQKEHKKRCEAGRGGNQALLRREKTVLAATGNFLFRHYESTDRYMAQYRENHSTSCMEREMSSKPVLGVDVPDPYLPKITSSSVLMERLKIIEALSEYYKFANDTRCSSDTKNVCLTGKTAESIDRKSLPPTPRKSNEGTLPALMINSASNVSDSQCLPTVREHEHEECVAEVQQEPSMCGVYSEITKNDDIRCIRLTRNKKDTSKTHVETDNKSKKESFVLPAAKLVCNDMEKQREYLKTAFPRIPLWTEYDPNNQGQRTERVLETLRIGSRKTKSSAKKDGSSSNQRNDESFNLRTNLDTREGMPPPSRGNLRLGTTVRPTTNHKQIKRKSTINQTQSNKFEVYNNNCYPPETFHSVKKPKHPVETTFIKILGHQTAPMKPSNPKPGQRKTTPRTKYCQSSDKDFSKGIPLHYFRRKRHNLNHVLEARSYKPENRKLGATVIPN